MAAEGPPTTLSDKGVDRVAFLQGNLARDATYFLNGTPVGARDLFQVCPALAALLPDTRSSAANGWKRCLATMSAGPCI